MNTEDAFLAFWIDRPEIMACNKIEARKIWDAATTAGSMHAFDEFWRARPRIMDCSKPEASSIWAIALIS